MKNYMSVQLRGSGPFANVVTTGTTVTAVSVATGSVETEMVCSVWPAARAAEPGTLTAPCDALRVTTAPPAGAGSVSWMRSVISLPSVCEPEPYR